MSQFEAENVSAMEGCSRATQEPLPRAYMGMCPFSNEKMADCKGKLNRYKSISQLTNQQPIGLAEFDMSKNNEFLSDLLDDQCSSKDFDSLLGDHGNIEKWYRYSTVNAILDKEYSANASFDFCQKVSDAVANEPAIIAAPRNEQYTQALFPSASESRSHLHNTKFKRFTGGFAIAASVALATFFSVQSLQVSNLSSLEQQNVAKIDHSTQDRIIANQAKQALPTNTKGNLEQMELELFNDIFMFRARQSEQESIAPFATRVGGEYVKTIRFSAAQWQQLLQKNAQQKAYNGTPIPFKPETTDELQDNR